MRIHALAALAAASAALVAHAPVARACGCLSSPMPPPDPPPGEVSYAVNQQSEQIIFEAEPGWVTAHVLIRYAGDPSQFAWLVPVPEVPELSIDPITTFGLLDNLTKPVISVTTDDICPQSQWACNYHAPLYCGPGGADEGGAGYFPDAAAGSYDAAPGGGSAVTVISEQTVGDYQTVIFRASEAGAATQWLQDNGFIVNSTTSIYMESYVAANMVFVAAKLVPGAGVKSIKPLRMRYRAANPTVPLILTAVAAQPNLTVTTFIFSDTLYRPLGHPVVSIDPKRLAVDTLGRLNYPQVMARMIDEAGGDAFVYEYRGTSKLLNTSACCSAGTDVCGLGFDGQCECPGTDFDGADCSQIDGLNEGAQLLQQLGQNYQFLTRVTTRVSPEEMTFDPAFEADPSNFANGTLNLSNNQASLARCMPAVLDQPKLQAIVASQACAATYCGPHGQCVLSSNGPACACGEGYVAMQYTDNDSQQSVTCVPATPPVDFRAGGAVLPDACASVSCGAGTCVDRNGIAVCVCNANTAAAPQIAGTTPICSSWSTPTGGPGAQDYSRPLRDLAVCAPKPPACGDGGWLSQQAVAIPGVDCGDSVPAHALTVEPDKPSCGLFSGCGCQGSPEGTPLAVMGGAWLLGLVILRRRRA